MPLSKAKQAEYMREYRRKGVIPSVIPNPIKGVIPSVIPKAGLIFEGNRIVGVAKTQTVQPGVPLYNPTLHKPGDRVLVRSPYSKKLIEMVLPEIDAEGNPVPSF